MKSNLPQVMDWVFLHEGGYAERDSEPGGAVNMGISFTAFKDWWKKTRKEGEPTFANLKALTRAEAETIYETWFFAPMGFDKLPSGVDYALVDLAVNSGVSGALKATSRQLLFPVTGRMTPQLSWALRFRDSRAVINAICDARLALMRSSSKWERFKDNWTKRVDKVRERSLQLARFG